MFLSNDHGLEQAGGTAALSFGRALVPVATLSPLDRLRIAAARTDWAPDLGAQIGSATWWRGAATCAALCAASWALAPGFHNTIIGAAPPALTGSDLDEAHHQAIAPLAFGGTTGEHLAATDLVAPLAETPERPRVELAATVGQGDDFAGVLQRAGVSPTESARVAQMVSGTVALGDIKPGTRIDLTLGRRPDKTVARPLEQLSFRARFDLNLAVARAGDALRLVQQAIAIDHTPLRIQGLVGSSLYRSARAAGAPAKVVEAYIKAVATRMPIGQANAGDTFDITMEQARAATGEVQLGNLLFAGLNQDRRKLQLVKWTDGEWYEASGQSEHQGDMGLPVTGHITSTFGMRMHPLLGFMRMHKGLDIGAAWGTPVHAATDGVIVFAGRSAGYGNFIKLATGGAIGTGYGHLSRILVRPGQRVARGQVIGAVGSTGMSTGPHLHWEVWKNGIAVNPKSVSFASISQLSGEALRAFKAKVAALLSVRPGAR
ncbi:MAG: peptidoglycan DD-metalloendopeptidase family protein [Sphingomonas sp.]